MRGASHDKVKDVFEEKSWTLLTDSGTDGMGIAATASSGEYSDEPKALTDLYLKRYSPNV